MKKELLLEVLKGGEAMKSAVLEYGITGKDLFPIVELMGKSTYKEIRQEFSQIMGENGLDGNFRGEEFTRSDLKTMAESAEQHAETLSERAYEAHMNGEDTTILRLRMNKQAEWWFAYDSAYHETEFLIPEMCDRAFTIELVGTNTFKIKGGGYILPTNIKTLLQAEDV